MESKKRIKYKKKSRKSSKNLFHKLKRYFKKLVCIESTPKKYRPYLGLDVAKDQVKKQSFENTRANHKKYTKRQRKRKNSITGTFKNLKREWNQLLYGRKKKKHKYKIKHKKKRLKKK